MVDGNDRLAEEPEERKKAAGEKERELEEKMEKKKSYMGT